MITAGQNIAACHHAVHPASHLHITESVRVLANLQLTAASQFVSWVYHPFAETQVLAEIDAACKHVQLSIVRPGESTPMRADH